MERRSRTTSSVALLRDTAERHSRYGNNVLQNFAALFFSPMVVTLARIRRPEWQPIHEPTLVCAICSTAKSGEAWTTLGRHASQSLTEKLATPNAYWPRRTVAQLNDCDVIVVRCRMRARREFTQVAIHLFRILELTATLIFGKATVWPAWYFAKKATAT